MTNALMLSTTARGGFLEDADAAAFIAARRSAGETWTATMRGALDAFVRAEKTAGRWPLIKRLYLPTSGIAAANAIDLKTRATGTFFGTVTPAAGYIQPDGSTGYFNSDTSPSAAGLTTTSGILFALCPAADTRSTTQYLAGSRDGGDLGECAIYQNGSSTDVSAFMGRFPGVELASTTAANLAGVLAGNRRGSGLKVSRRDTSTNAYGANQPLVANTISATVMSFGCLNNNGSPILHTNARFGVMGFGLGLATDADVDAFTLAVKTMWEAITGLSLP